MKLAAVSLTEISKRCRLNCLDVLEAAGVGHNGGSMSVIDILVALYFGGVARIRPEEPKWPDRDRIIFSKAHSCEGLYAVLGEAGFFPKTLFKTYGSFNSLLQGHAEIFTPGVEYSGGSLGQGMSFAMGIALAAKLNQKSYRTFAVLGDGECQEGQVWEAAMLAPKYNLNNLTIIVDSNGYNTISKTESALTLFTRWSAFDWYTRIVDGHDFMGLIQSLSFRPNLPYCIIAKTIKGKGIPLWENSHSHILAGENLTKGIEEGRKLLS
jgi:transketolase